MVIKVHHPKRPLKMIRPNGPDNNDYEHEIMQVTLKTGEVYAVDITGAQHGYYDSVYPWHRYLQTRVRSTGELLSFGASKAKYCGAEWCGQPGYKGAVKIMHREFAVAFDRAVGEWQAKGVGVAEMLRMGEEGFVRTREELMRHVGGALQDFKRVFERRLRCERGSSADPGMRVGGFLETDSG